MSEYRFHLQKYLHGSKTTCPNCGKSRCFVKYIDEQGVISFPDNVGKCDHENSCGYHYTPKEYWKSHATLTLLATQDLPTFGYNMIDPLKSWCWGSILFYPFKISRFS